MKTVKTAIGVSFLLLVTVGALAQQKDEQKPETLVRWMRAVNTFEFEYKASHGRFGGAEELMAYLKTRKPSKNPVLSTDLSPAAMQPYVLNIVTNADGSHYVAKIEFPSNMQVKSTWCKTSAFSDDSGLISLGQNIQCSGASALGASSSPEQ